MGAEPEIGPIDPTGRSSGHAAAAPPRRVMNSRRFSIQIVREGAL
jgi:hypothetical protein